MEKNNKLDVININVLIVSVIIKNSNTYYTNWNVYRYRKKSKKSLIKSHQIVSEN